VVAGAGAQLKLEPLAVIVERWPELAPPALVKIDTDGFDCQIVESAIDLWRTWKCVLFIEFDPHFYPSTWSSRHMFESLHAIGYDVVLAYENTGEYSLATSLADEDAMSELHRRYAGSPRGQYADLCIFHSADRSLADAFRRAEESRARVRPDAPDSRGRRA
jgi:hypothetical protein